MLGIHKRHHTEKYHFKRTDKWTNEWIDMVTTWGNEVLRMLMLIVNNLFQYKRHLAWIIINNLLHKINHHSKNHTSSLDQKSVMAKKNPRSRCRLCGSASTGLAFQIFEASLLHTIPFHPLQLQPCCPNSRPQGVDDPFYDSRSLGSAISQSAVSKPIKYT